MSYVKAEEILPRELLEAIQQYVNGQVIYIPCKEKKDWGSKTETKQYYETRNQEIYNKYINGVSTTVLATEYALSVKSINRVLRNARRIANENWDRSILLIWRAIVITITENTETNNVEGSWCVWEYASTFFINMKLRWNFQLVKSKPVYKTAQQEQKKSRF